MKMTKVLSQLENGVPFSKTGFFSPNDSVHSELYIFAPIQIQNIEYGINIKYKNKTETDSWLIDWSIGSTVNLSTTKNHCISCPDLNSCSKKLCEGAGPKSKRRMTALWPSNWTMSRLPELDGGAILWRVFAHLSQLVKLHGHRHRDLARVAPVKILDLLQPATGGQKVILWAIMI